jgi:hypothetical protein
MILGASSTATVKLQQLASRRPRQAAEMVAVLLLSLLLFWKALPTSIPAVQGMTLYFPSFPLGIESAWPELDC